MNDLEDFSSFLKIPEGMFLEYKLAVRVYFSEYASKAMKGYGAKDADAEATKLVDKIFDLDRPALRDLPGHTGTSERDMFNDLISIFYEGYKLDVTVISPISGDDITVTVSYNYERGDAMPLVTVAQK